MSYPITKNKIKESKNTLPLTISLRINLSRFDHLTVFQAGRTNADPFNSAVEVSPHPLQIRQPSSSARIVSMTHLVPV